jgi:hypothetical protein
MWNGAEASWKKLGSSLFTQMFLWREHTILLEPRLFLGAAFYFPAGDRAAAGVFWRRKETLILETKEVVSSHSFV